MKNFNKIITMIMVVVTTLIIGNVSIATTEEQYFIERVSGDNRIETSIKASSRMYDKSDVVVLSGYGGDVDALTGTILASYKEAPILITNKNELSDLTKLEILRLQADVVYLLGGENTISKSVENELEELGLTVWRLAGKDRIETASKIAEEVKVVHANTVFLTKGYSADGVLADALSIGTVSARDQVPVLLTETNKVPDRTLETLKNLKVPNIIIVGGYNAVSLRVQEDLESRGHYVERISGCNREGTATKIASKYFDDPSKLIIVNGRQSADALIGGYYGAKINSPILLVSDAISSETERYMKENSRDIEIIGGSSVVSDEVERLSHIIINKL